MQEGLAREIKPVDPAAARTTIARTPETKTHRSHILLDADMTPVGTPVSRRSPFVIEGRRFLWRGL